MKATDLRIGNFVEILGKIETVVDVMCDSVNTTTCEGVPYDMVHPIPLTEEWLEKFGFILRDCGFVRLYDKKHGSMRCLKYYTKDHGKKMAHNVYWGVVNIKHIHQIQNLYHAITGEELELKNPKP
jgi:hypothetical protein